MPQKEKLQIEIEVPSKKIRVSHVHCPNGHNLCDPSVKINDFPSIRLKLKNKMGEEGFLYLDPVYGSFQNREEGIQIAADEVVDAFCPECGVSLTSPDETCQLCASPMFLLHLPKGGIIEGCLKKGCYFHRMKIVDAEEQIARLFENHTLESYL
ncbi:MAG: hypothetical protein P8184_17655 [Calditrichia bacterium]